MKLKFVNLGLPLLGLYEHIFVGLAGTVGLNLLRQVFYKLFLGQESLRLLLVPFIDILIPFQVEIDISSCFVDPL